MEIFPPNYWFGGASAITRPSCRANVSLAGGARERGCGQRAAGRGDADGEREAAHVRHIIGLLLLASAWHAAYVPGDAAQCDETRALVSIAW